MQRFDHVKKTSYDVFFRIVDCRIVSSLQPKINHFVCIQFFFCTAYCPESNPVYSRRMASRAEIFTDRLAGINPEMTPTIAEKIRANTTSQSGITEARFPGVNRKVKKDSSLGVIE